MRRAAFIVLALVVSGCVMPAPILDAGYRCAWAAHDATVVAHDSTVQQPWKAARVSANVARCVTP